MEAKSRSVKKRRLRAAQAYKRPRTIGRTPEVRIAGPEHFSIINNPEEMIQFFRSMASAKKPQTVHVDLRQVKTMTPDAIAGLLAAIHHCNTRGVSVVGNDPEDTHPKAMLNESGFRDYVRSRTSFIHPPKMGSVFKFSSSGEAAQNKFDQRIANSLVQFAGQKLTGVAKSHGPSYSVFCEAMLNTWNHAAKPEKERKHWWASAYFDSTRNRACFTFLDRGLGIFKSHRLTTKLKLLKTFQFLSSAELLRRIFRGEIPSTTREPGRGNGLPGMYDHCKAGRIKSLTVVSNDVLGKVETETYETLSGSFEGTLIYWEI
jgi:hypothetical protein